MNCQINAKCEVHLSETSLCITKHSKCLVIDKYLVLLYCPGSKVAARLPYIKACLIITSGKSAFAYA